MPRICLSLSLAAIWLACACGSGFAADEKPNPPKYTWSDPKHKEFKSDLTNPADREALIERLQKGEVEHLELDKPMPDIMNVAADTAIWAIVVFVLLLVILRKMAWGPMLEGLQKREDSIRSAVEEAKKAREETVRVTTQFQQEMAQKMAEIPKIMEEARRDAEQLKEEMRAQAGKDIQAERQRLRREIDIAKDQALHELWAQAAQLATLISAKAIGRHLSEDDHRRLVDEALNELAQR